MYLPGPMVLNVGFRSSLLSCEINRLRIYGCSNAINVKDDAVSPGVFEKISMHSPKANPQSNVAHCGLYLLKRNTK